MPTRRKNNRVVPCSAPGVAPHGRPREAAASRRSHTRASDPATKYALERFNVRLALAEGDRRGRRAAQDRAERALARLRATPQGAHRAQAINLSLAKVDAAIRSAANAHVEMKPYAVATAVFLLKLIDEHDVQSIAALELLGGAAANLKLAAMLRDLAFRKNPGVLSATKSGKAEDDDAGHVTLTLGAFGDLLKLATTLDAAGRNDLATALDLEQRARAEQSRKPFNAVAFLGSVAPEADDDDDEDDADRPVHRGHAGASASDPQRLGPPGAHPTPSDAPGGAWSPPEDADPPTGARVTAGPRLPLGVVPPPATHRGGSPP